MKKVMLLWFCLIGALQAQVTFNATGGSGTNFSVQVVFDGVGGGGAIYRMSAKSPGTPGVVSAIIRGTGADASRTYMSTDTIGGTSTPIPFGAAVRLSLFANSQGTGEIGSFFDYGQWTNFTAESGGSEPPKRVTVSLRNTSGVPVTYKLVGPGGPDEPLGEVTLQPGQAMIQEFDVPNGVDPSALQVVSQVNGYVNGDGGVWIVQEGAVHSQTVVPAGGISSTNLTPEGTAPTPEQVVPVPPPSEAPSGGPASASSGGTVWHVDQEASATADLLTRKTYREGVDKLQVTMASVRDAINGTPQT